MGRSCQKEASVVGGGNNSADRPYSRAPSLGTNAAARKLEAGCVARSGPVDSSWSQSSQPPRSLSKRKWCPAEPTVSSSFESSDLSAHPLHMSAALEEVRLTPAFLTSKQKGESEHGRETGSVARIYTDVTSDRVYVLW